MFNLKLENIADILLGEEEKVSYWIHENRAYKIYFETGEVVILGESEIETYDENELADIILEQLYVDINLISETEHRNKLMSLLEEI